jgi:putative transposase
MDKFRGKYRIPTARLQSWDYGNHGAYFLTICTQEMVHYFGEVENGEMQLSMMGELAEKFWLEIPNQFPYIELGNLMVMPNHVHGILLLDTFKIPNPNGNKIAKDVEENGGFATAKNPMLGENISKIIRWFKGRCTFEIRKLHSQFRWQTRFYDTVIKDADSFERIQNYILKNPERWQKKVESNCL